MAATEQVDEWGKAISAGLSALPWGATAVALTLLVGGLLMWLLGRRVMRPAFFVIFAAGGAAGGLLLPPALGFDLNPHASMGIGALIGAIVGLLAFRFAMALSLSLVVGVAATLATSVALAQAPAAAPEQEHEERAAQLEQQLQDDLASMREKADNLWRTSENLFKNSSPPQSTRPDDVIEEPQPPSETEIVLLAEAERIRAVLRHVRAKAHERWLATPVSHRMLLALAAFTGGLVGFLIGLAKPRHAAALTTAFAGAALTLFAVGVLLRLHELPGAGLFPSTSAAWLAVWGGAAVIGVVAQWTALRRRADKSPSA